jgi:hypothetical protein
MWCGGGRYVGGIVRNLGVSEEGEKCNRWVCRINRCPVRLLQAKDKEKV